MEEKERYVFKGLLDNEVVIDNETNEELSCLCELVSRLNLQDKRIKELEQKNRQLKLSLKQQERKVVCWQDVVAYLEKVKRLEEENQQLKEKLKDIKNNYRQQIDSLLIARLNLFKQLKQSQKQLAIDTLEKVISLCRNGISDYYSLQYVCTIIENQLKNLKH